MPTLTLRVLNAGTMPRRRLSIRLSILKSAIKRPSGFARWKNAAIASACNFIKLPRFPARTGRLSLVFAGGSQLLYLSQILPTPRDSPFTYLRRHITALGALAAAGVMWASGHRWRKRGEKLVR